MAYGISAARMASALALVVACSTPLAAQTGSPETDIDALIDAGATNEGAIASARSQADGGDLLGAAGTLERALLERPGAESDNIRLYYATVLCRLDDKRRAAHQLGNVRDAAAGGWNEARAACGDIATPAPSPSRANGIAGELSVGLAYDGDAYGALATEVDLPAIPTLAEDGLSITTSAQLNGRFGSTENSYFYGGASFLSKDSVAGPKLDYQVGGARLGFATRLGENTELSFGGVVRHARLFNDPFVTEYGGQASLGIRSGEHGRWSIDVEAVDQDYRGGVVPSARDGMRYDFAVSYANSPTPERSWVVGAAFELKDADTRSLGYRGGRVFAGARLPVAENGTYVGLSGTVRYVDYRDPAVGADLKEWRLFGRAAVGVPLGPKGLFLEPAVSYSARLYNNAAALRDYDSFGAELRLVYRF